MDDVYASKPWLKSYDKHVPPIITNYPQTSCAEAMREAFDGVPDRMALNYMGTNISFREFDTYSSQFAHFLISQGCCPGDVVGVHLLNVPASFFAAIGIQKAGCVFTGISILLTAEELEYQLNDSGAKILLTFDFNFKTVKKAVVKTKVKTVVVVSIADFLPYIKKTLGTLLKKIPTGEVHSLPNIEVVRFLKAIEGRPKDLVNVKVKPDDPCLMMYTGGTTGPPKGAVLTQANVVCHMKQMRTWTGFNNIGEHTIASAFPLFHQAGNFLSLWAIAMGASAILLTNPRDLKFMCKAMKKLKPTALINVPTLYLELMKRPDFKALDFSSFQFFVSGASPFPAESILDFEKIVGQGKVMEVYGMTETTPLITANPMRGLKKVGSVGIPMVGTEVRLVDPSTGEPVPMGQPGEIVVKGPQVFKGYHNKPEENANSFRNGWFHTGDIAEMDEDGYFFIVDRLKDMVSVSGFKVFTRVVDDILMEHPDIDMAATIGIPDPKRPGSEIVASAIKLKPGIEKSDAERKKLVEYMKERVAPYKVPKVMEFMDELPLSAVGKILKRELRNIMIK
ncbi:MAG: AMP-binding protein [Smithella sp.]|jgi:long-chain acyl-CoA synthetase